tara:strand:- start:518 stop:964 length:447 start_codon:yes stop_codon:yes gene_type:complete
MIDYNKILYENMVNVFKDILKNISENGLSNGNHLYVTFLTNKKNVMIPNWLLEKYPNEITIVIQFEYHNLIIEENYFQIELSFNEIMSKIKVPYDAVVSFADPSSNFGLKLHNTEQKNISKNINKNKNQNKTENKNSNIIDFSNFKKN